MLGASGLGSHRWARHSFGVRMSVIKIDPVEIVRLDEAKLLAISAQFGANAAVDLYGHAMEDLAVSLSRLTKYYERGDLRAVSDQLAEVVTLAEPLGMSKLKRVASDAAYLAELTDGAALAAVIARLDRIGQSSLMAACEVDIISR